MNGFTLQANADGTMRATRTIVVGDTVVDIDIFVLQWDNGFFATVRKRPVDVMSMPDDLEFTMTFPSNGADKMFRWIEAKSG